MSSSFLATPTREAASANAPTQVARYNREEAGGCLQTATEFANRIGVHGTKGKHDGICENPSRADRNRRGANNEGRLQPKRSLSVEACEGLSETS